MIAASDDENVIDLKPYAPKRVVFEGSLQLTHKAEMLGIAMLVRHNTKVDRDQLRTLLATAVAAFFASPYMQHEWFQKQRIHTFEGVSLLSPAGERVDMSVLHLFRHDNGVSLLAPDELPVPDDYMEQRLIAEVQVECAAP